MSWTYTGNPADSNVDGVRYLVGQTSTSDPVLVNDQEIAFAVTHSGNIWAAAVLVAESLLGQYAGKDADSITVGNLSESYGDRSAKLQARLPNLRRQAAMRNVVPVAGGLTIAQRQDRAADTSLVPDIFQVGMTDNPPGLADNASTGY